jgi:hypothetical protein
MPGEDPRRNPGLWLMVLAMAALIVIVIVHLATQ